MSKYPKDKKNGLSHKISKFYIIPIKSQYIKHVLDGENTGIFDSDLLFRYILLSSLNSICEYTYFFKTLETM